MPFEDAPPPVAVVRGPGRGRLTDRRCTCCGSVGYALPGQHCRIANCPGTLDRWPGWKTNLAPRAGNGFPLTLAYGGRLEE